MAKAGSTWLARSRPQGARSLTEADYLGWDGCTRGGLGVGARLGFHLARPMRLLPAILLTAVLFSGCSGVPPETLIPLQGGETAGGLTLGVDLNGKPNPDIGMWFSGGLGRGVDASVGVDVPLGLMVGGPRMVVAPLRGLFPGLSLRKTFDSGVGVGIGSGSRFLFVPSDSSGSVPHVSTAGVFVTTATPTDQTMQGRATLHLGYAQIRRPNTLATQRGLALHGVGTGGPAIAMADTARAILAVRVQAGAFIWPRPSLVQGPTLGLTAQMVDVAELD